MAEKLVTCLCLTKDRREWLPQAIACFERQTYPHRELLIVADKAEDWQGLLPPVLERPAAGIRVIQTGPACVGKKRNLGNSLAIGEIIAHWDDDDYSAPGRLADQVARLETSGKAVTGYHTMKFTNGQRWWQYVGPVRGFGMATSLCYRREWWRTHRFHEIQSGQDEVFGTQAAAQGQLEPAPDLDLMYATIHKGNTSPRAMNGSCWLPLPGFEWQEAACGV